MRGYISQTLALFLGIFRDFGSTALLPVVQGRQLPVGVSRGATTIPSKESEENLDLIAHTIIAILLFFNYWVQCFVEKL